MARPQPMGNGSRAAAPIFATIFVASGISSPPFPQAGIAARRDSGQPRSSGSAPGSTDCPCDTTTTTLAPALGVDASIEIRDGTNTAVCPAGFVTRELYLFAEDDLPKDGWNWALVHSDSSQGVHNPSFVREVLDASIDALER